MDKFEEIIAPLLGDYEDLSQETMFGIRIMFCDEETGEREQHMLPWLSTNEEMAALMLDRLLHTEHGARSMAAFMLSRRIKESVHPEAARIVCMAEIPF